ncbi:MAG: hypothetical protein PUE76_03995 [Bacteroides sp.]|nr:hypothetical protein [Bacteroides sp.]
MFLKTERGRVPPDKKIGVSRTDLLSRAKRFLKMTMAVFSGCLIWLGYSYMPPVTSVAGGLYSIWQNIINFLELYEQSHRTGKRINKH